MTTLFNEHITDSQDQETYITNFSVGQHWVLNEHRIMRNATLPGTAYLEMARAACLSIRCQCASGHQPTRRFQRY
ncbi:MAG: hypothetical protein DRI57_18770 [Deltaproteobacteria bacterium]|nr:MAG: hypothetical protein DRI57_18770 [Deltaproteobacteria bacterium]